MELLEHQISEHVTVIGGPWAYLYFVQGERSVLIDTGMSFQAQTIADQLAKLSPLGLWGIAHTHSHFDHIGCTPYLIDRFGPLEVIGHPRIRKVLDSANAIGLIASLNESISQAFDQPAPSFKPFVQSIDAEDEARIDLGNGVVLRCLHTPGHTRDSVSYCIEPDQVIVTGEAAGVPIGTPEEVQCEFLTSHEDYLQSIVRLQQLGVESIGLPHVLFVEGRQASAEYLERSYGQSLVYIDRLRSAFITEGDGESVFEQIYEEDFGSGKISQPEPAYRLNLQAQVRLIGKEFS